MFEILDPWHVFYKFGWNIWIWQNFPHLFNNSLFFFLFIWRDHLAYSNEKLEKYDSSPEDHPKYAEEWKKFWQIRYAEVKVNIFFCMVDITWFLS